MIFLPSAKFIYRPQTAVAPWTPLSLGNTVLYGWYKGDAGLSVSTDGASVAAWNDQSTNNNHLSQTTTANQPVFRTAANGVNGIPVLEFPSSATTPAFFNETAFPANTNGFSFYIVSRNAAHNASAQYTGAFVIGNLSAGGVNQFCNVPGDTLAQRIRANGISPDFGESIISNNFTVTKVSRAAALTSLKYRTTYTPLQLNTTANPYAIQPGFYIGRNYNGSVGGKIAEVIVCNKELDTTEEASLDAYFRSRYGFGLYYGADLPVANPALWLDASRSDTLFVENTLTTPVTTDNGPVGGWKDLSGNNRHALQSTNSARPTWRTPINGQNGLGVTSFNGSSQWIMSPLSTSTPYTQFVVVKVKDNLRINRVLHGGTSTQDSRYLLGSSSGNYAIYLSSNNSSWTGGALPLPPTTSIHNIWKNLSVTNTGTSTGLQPYVNNAALNAGNGTLASFSNMTIGYGPSLQYASMDLAEVIQYDFVLNATQLASVNAYLSAKWGT